MSELGGTSSTRKELTGKSSSPQTAKNNVLVAAAASTQYSIDSSIGSAIFHPPASQFKLLEDGVEISHASKNPSNEASKSKPLPSVKSTISVVKNESTFDPEQFLATLMKADRPKDSSVGSNVVASMAGHQNKAAISKLKSSESPSSSAASSSSSSSDHPFSSQAASSAISTLSAVTPKIGDDTTAAAAARKQKSVPASSNSTAGDQSQIGKKTKSGCGPKEESRTDKRKSKPTVFRKSLTSSSPSVVDKKRKSKSGEAKDAASRQHPESGRNKQSSRESSNASSSSQQAQSQQSTSQAACKSKSKQQQQQQQQPEKSKSDVVVRNVQSQRTSKRTTTQSNLR